MTNNKNFIKNFNLDKSQYDNYFDCFLKLKNIENNRKGKLIIVTSINPTPEGEGKTTLLIGLTDAFNYNNKKAIGTLREPSMGPVFGIKGGATGGGKSKLENDDLINLNFTGDFHSITTANNLISAIIENEIFFNSNLNIDVNRILWNRCLDSNDRGLRNINIKINDEKNYQTSFNITAASDLMALFCLAKNIDDFEEKLNNTLVAYSCNDKPIRIADLKISKAIIKILEVAFNPNVAYSICKSPFLIHGGPFANIAHGCNSIIATNTALSLADYVLTECGFGADLGFEKLMNIKMQEANLKPSLVIICITLKSLIHHGKSKATINEQIEYGFNNLLKHHEHVKYYGFNPLVVINVNNSDTRSGLNKIIELCKKNNLEYIESNIYNQGPKNTKGIISKIDQMIDDQKDNKIKFLYDVNNDNLETKVSNICKIAYGAKKIIISDKVKSVFKKKELQNFYVCMSKTQYSLSSTPDLIEEFENVEIEINDYVINYAANIVVFICGSIMRMPGLSKEPRAKNFKI